MTPNESPAALLPELIAKLRERYKASAIPTCRVCGGPLSIQSFGGGRPTVYGCDGQEDDPNRPGWLRYREGRRCADQHYSDSQLTDYSSGGDSDVLQLCDLIASTAPVASESRGSAPDVSDDDVESIVRAALTSTCSKAGVRWEMQRVIHAALNAAPTPPAVANEEGAFTARVVEWKGIRFGVPAQIAKSFMAALEGTNGEPPDWAIAQAFWEIHNDVDLVGIDAAAFAKVSIDKARELARSAAAKGEGPQQNTT